MRVPAQKSARLLLATIACSGVIASTGCLERLFPDQVAEGVSRLTIRQAGTILSAVNADENCGFASADVIAAGKASAPPGSVGTYTTEVVSCVIDFGTGTELGEDCEGSTSTASGKITVSGTRTLHGIITGVTDGDPVIPAASTSVTIRLVTEFDEFKVEGPDGRVLTQKSGSLAMTGSPLLAVSNENPTVCSVPTSKIAMTDVIYDNAVVHLDADGQAFEVDIATSNLTAFAGEHTPDIENQLSGSITIWGTETPLAAGLPLDPDYDRERFNSTWQCNAEGATRTFLEPISHQCEGVGELVASGATRLAVQNFGMVASLLESDTNCGFSSKEVLESVVTDSPPGTEGTATVTVTDCTMNFPENTVITTDCDGNRTFASGTVTVSGTKALSGRLTGGIETPAIPLTDSPVTITLDAIRFENFRIQSESRVEFMTNQSGSLSGSLQIRTAVGADTGACSVPTSMVRMNDLSFADAEILVNSPSGTFQSTINASNIRAVNGTWENDSNFVGGSITLDDTEYTIADLPDGTALNSSFDQALFDASWQCGDELRLPVSFECDFEPTLAQGAAQLSVSLFGQVVSALEADTACGFSSPAVMEAAVVEGELGRRGGSATFTVEDCTLDFGAGVLGEADCNGNATELRGRVTVSGTKTLAGIVSGDPGEPIVPEDWEPASFDLVASFDNFSERSASREQYLTARSGTLAGKLTPRTGLDTNLDVCSIPTTAVAVRDLQWTDGDAAIFASGTIIDIAISSADLTAQNGKGALGENRLDGTIQLGERTFDIPVDPENPGLDPNYDADAFVSSFACKENFALPASVEECNFEKTIAEGAARLIIQTMGEVAGRTNADADCGFSNTLGVRANPLEVVGEPGEQGSMLFGIEGCELTGEGLDTPSDVDCVGKETFTRGSFSSSGTLLVTGLRESIIFGIDSIAPDVRESVTLTIDSAEILEEFQSFGVGPNGEEDLGYLTVHSGNFSGVVKPIMGYSVAEERYVAPTPVAELIGINLAGADVTLQSQGKTFRFTVDSSSLNAFNGSFGGRSNEINGTITIDGDAYIMGEQSLVPDFSQADFDAAYACETEDDLREIIPTN